MVNLSAEQKLDLILKVLVDHAKPKDSIVTVESLTEYFTDRISEVEIKLIIEKLIKDELAKKSPWMNIELYNVTFDGLVFIGYEKKKILEDEEISKILNTEKRVVDYETKLYRATLLAGIVAALLLLWQVFLYFYPVHKDYTYWIWETVPKTKK